MLLYAGTDHGVTAAFPPGPIPVEARTADAYAHDASAAGASDGLVAGAPASFASTNETAVAASRRGPELMFEFRDPLPKGASIELPPVSKEYERKRSKNAPQAQEVYNKNLAMYSNRYKAACHAMRKICPGKSNMLTDSCISYIHFSDNMLARLSYRGCISSWW